MKVCGFCGTRLKDESGDYADCPNCENTMEVVTIEETSTKDIDEHSIGISNFYGLDFLTQRDYIMASDGTDIDKLNKLNKYIDINFKEEIKRKKWHEEEQDIMIEMGCEDWNLAEEYKTQHSPYYDKNVLIKEVWRDKDNNLCIQYVSSFGRMLDWFHYKIDNGELEWW